MNSIFAHIKLAIASIFSNRAAARAAYDAAMSEADITADFALARHKRAGTLTDDVRRKIEFARAASYAAADQKIGAVTGTPAVI
jgi:hypothetical protein